MSEETKKTLEEIKEKILVYKSDVCESDFEEGLLQAYENCLEIIDEYLS